VRCPPLPEAIFVDHDMWEKIVLNLLSNALKYTFTGRISVALAWQDDHVELTVADTGTGIPEAELPHIFERFHRVQGSRSRTHEGSGIGLALVHELVNLHRGRIRVESRIDAGTTFVVSIPAGSGHLPHERIRAPRALVSTATGATPFVQEAFRWLPDGPASSEAPTLDASSSGPTRALELAPDLGSHLLVVDDNADMREYLVRLLRERWTVSGAADGLRALESVRREKPDLILTDVMMPNLDGFGLLRELRADPKTESVPVIMLSARAGEESRIDGLEAGADDYLVKPFSARELLARVATHLQIARLRQEALKQRQRLHDIFTQAPVAVAVLSGPELRFEVANAPFCEMVARTELVGRSLREAFPEPGALQQIELIESAHLAGEPLHLHEQSVYLERRGVTSEGFFNYVLQPIKDEIGGDSGVIIAATEVTEAVLARRRVDNLRLAAEQANRAKDEFLSALSHELRTPLSAIVGWSNLLRSGVVPENQRERALETIERNARVQARLIEDLLDLSRIEQGKLVLSVGPLEMIRVVEAAIEAVRPAADAKGIRLQPVLDSHATIVGDADRLQQVAWNLLSNAIKFTPRGGRVQVRVRREQSYVEVAVADDGQGIEASFLPYVFDRFRQGDPSFTRKNGGLGLGLAIVRSLVELHGGSVDARSDGVGMGATFVVRLPMAPLRADSRPTPTDPTPGVPVGVRFEAPETLRNLNILVVDDEPETRELLKFVIAQCSAHVTTAADAGEALQLLETRAFELLISDIGMPGEDGYSLVRKVRELPATQNGNIPALALTAYARSEDRTQALRAGFNMHLAKPIEPAELLAVLEALVRTVPPRP
jgi:signal transduction histidine kinase